MALLHLILSPVSWSSTHTSLHTSMLVPKARLTWLLMVTRSPSLIGRSKLTLFTAMVTTTRLQCRCALTAELMSSHCSSLPPKRLPSVLVSLGSTKLVVSA